MTFDATTPAWDGEVNVVADFDAEADADGDLNDHADAAHDGATGLEITFDDNTVAYGTLNLDAVDQSSCVATFWFDPNDVAIENARYIELYRSQGAGISQSSIRLYNNGGVYQWRIYIRTDTGITYSSFANLPVMDYQKINLFWKASSGPGNDDGYARLYVDDVLLIEETGVDNDEQDMDYCVFGMRYTGSTTFGGSFYMDTIKIDPVGAPMADKLAAVNGTYGMAIPIMDTTARYGEFTDPDAETGVMAECMLDPNGMTVIGEFYFIYSSVFRVTLFNDGEYKIRIRVENDSAVYQNSSFYPIVDGENKIRMDWKASPGAGNDDGYMSLYIDDVLMETISGIDNDTKVVDSISFGAVSSIDAGTYGIFYMDDCRWRKYKEQLKFIGTMIDIDPSSGAFDNPITNVVAQDWMGYLNKQELGLQALQSDKRTDELLTTALAEFPNQPEATDFDTGVETFEVGFANDPSDSSMARFLAKIARNERGRIFSKGDGTLRFEKQGTRDGSQDSAFTIDGTMSEFDVSYSANNIYNTVALDIKTQIIDTAATHELFKVGQGIEFAAGQKMVGVEFNFTDPDTGQGVAGVDVVTPVAAPHFGTTRTPANDDSHADLTDDNYQVGATSLTVDLENTGGGVRYLNEFTILGKRLTDYDRITITKKNQTSINQIGNSKYTNRLDLIEDPTVAEDIADGILVDYAPSHTVKTRITVLANIDNDLAAALIIAEPSTLFTAIESITGISKDFYIDNIRYKQDHTLLWVTIDAEEA